MDDFQDSLVHHFLLTDQVREELVAAITEVLAQDDRIGYATLYGRQTKAKNNATCATWT